MENLVNYGPDVLIKEVIEFDARRDIHRATTVVSTVRNFHVGKIAHYTEGLKIVIRKVNFISVEIPQSSVSTCFMKPILD